MQVQHTNYDNFRFENFSSAIKSFLESKVNRFAIGVIALAVLTQYYNPCLSFFVSDGVGYLGGNLIGYVFAAISPYNMLHSVKGRAMIIVLSIAITKFAINLLQREKFTVATELFPTYALLFNNREDRALLMQIVPFMALGVYSISNNFSHLTHIMGAMSAHMGVERRLFFEHQQQIGAQ